MKGNEMLFEIIYIYILWFVGVVSVLYRWSQKRFVQENRKSRGDSNNING